MTVLKALVTIDTDMASLQAWISATPINSILGMTVVGGDLLILYT